MPGAEQRPEGQRTPTGLIIDAINTHLAPVVTCTLSQKEVKISERAFIEAISSDGRITRGDLIDFLRQAILRGKPIVNPSQRVGMCDPPQVGHWP
jgi:hypothetical protein